MLDVKNILRIRNFDFEDDKGNTKDKYFVIIYRESDKFVIAPLPTSIDVIPDHFKAGNRCIKKDDHGIHTYYLPAGVIIGQAGFSFPKDTFIHVSPVYLRLRSIDQLTEKYLKTGAARFVDTLTDSEYYDMLYCIYKSIHVPRNVKSKIENILHSLGKSLS